MRTSARIGQFFEHDFAGHAPIDPTLEPARQSASNPIAAISPNVNFIVGSLPTAPIPSQVRTGLTAGGDSLERTCLCRPIPCLAGKVQGIFLV
jgi:hypothetical protein